MTYNFFDRPALVLSLGALTLMACADAPVYIWFFCAILWCHKWISNRNFSNLPLRPIGRRMTTFLAVLILSVILFQYRSLFVQEAASSLLVALTAVKVLDYSNRRDHLIVILLGFLLLTLKPLFGLDLIWLPLQLICVIGLFWSLSHDSIAISRRVFLSLILSSVPLSLALFLVFPRVVLPWAMSQSKLSNSAKIGFTTKLNPGRFAELADSNEVAFRAIFPEGVIVDTKELYWRGAVLHKSLGLAWDKDQDEPTGKIDLAAMPETFKYDIVTEPANGNFLFTLDSTFGISESSIKILQLKNQIWKLGNGFNGAQRIKAEASWGFHDKSKPTKQDLQITKLPPKSEQWVQKTLKENPSLQSRRTALMALFTKSTFTYTQHPGEYSADAMDDFLFSKRRGFCEHFAGAYASLARALEIPARVISGYQGGDYNPVGKFWRVTQRYAHAWVEIWDGENWQRIDPTLWASVFEFRREREKQWADFISEGIDVYENINYRWTTFLLDFDQNSQLNSLKELLPQIIVFSLLLLAGVFVIKFILNWIMTPSKQRIVSQKYTLSHLVEEIRSELEIEVNSNMSHLTPLQIIELGQKKLFGPAVFYDNLSKFYDQIFYQELIDDRHLMKDIKNFQKKWVEIQLLRR